MSARNKKKTEFPFLFFAHGLWSYTDEIASVHLMAFFSSDVAAGERSAIEKSAPLPITTFSWPLPNLFRFGTEVDEYFDTKIWKVYGPIPRPLGVGDAEHDELEHEEDEAGEVTKQQAAAFCKALDEWLLATHSKHTVVAIVGWIGQDKKDPWAKWSSAAALDRGLPQFVALRQRVVAERSEDDQLLGVLDYLVYQAIVEFVEPARWTLLSESNLADETQALITSSLLGLLGTSKDASARYLYRRLTGVRLPPRVDE
jgi:hypothetical protein